MMIIIPSSSFIAWLVAACVLLPARPAAATEPTRAPSPRFATSTELFELVGVVQGRLLSLYLDRFDDNAPVRGARIELEIGGRALAVKEVATGEYEAELAAPLPPGVTAVTATVVAGAESDLLAADLDLPVPAAASASQGMRSGALAAIVVAALAAVTGLAFAVWRRRAGKRSTQEVA